MIPIHRGQRVARSVALGVVVATLTSLLCLGHAAYAYTTRDDPAVRDERLRELRSLDVEELLALRVVVSAPAKQEEELFQVSAAVSVVTAEDIRRSGATSIPEALRGVPGVDVARADANSWAVTARGFNNLFANNLLVLIDGRSVYSDFFSGVRWDAQDVVLEDIDRIEIVRGPGGSVWGANAVNGVINIVTRDAADTQGWLATALSGDYERVHGQLRYGGRVGEDFAWRIYGKYRAHEDFPGLDGRDGHDEWTQVRGGFRTDWRPTGADAVHVQGEFHEGNSGSRLTVPISPTQAREFRKHDDFRGAHVLARWRHRSDDGFATMVQAYYDRTSFSPPQFRERRDAFDLETQLDLEPVDWGGLGDHAFSFGTRYRMSAGRITRDSFFLTVMPRERTDHLFSAFIQDEISFLKDKLRIRVGTKLEHNDYTGWEFQPTLRAAVLPNDRHTVWAAVSRAIRRPSWSPTDVLVKAAVLPGSTLLVVYADPYADAETLWAFELGWRARLSDRITTDFAAYYNLYDRLRVNVRGAAPPPNLPPLGVTILADRVDNRGKGRSYGLEVGANVRVHERVTFRASYAYIDIFVESAGAVGGPLDLVETPATPEHRVSLQTTVSLPFDLEGTLIFHHVGRIEADDINAYERLDVRLGWRPTPDVELTFVGQNLTIDRHLEFMDSLFQSTEVPRSFYGKLSYRY